MELRPYQERAVSEAFTVPGRPIFCAPTGSGKTVVQAYIAERAMREGQSIAILTPRAEIFDQTHSTLMDVVGWQNVSTLRAGHRWDAMRRVHVVSWPTLIARLRKSEAWLPAVDMVLADECHLATAPQILNVLERYSDRKVIGFTATPARATGSGLGVYFDSIRQVTTVRELIQEGYLTPCEYWGGTLTDVTDVKIRQGDYDTKELSKRAVMIVGDVVENWLRLASDRHTIVFAVDIAHAEALHDRFLQSGVQSVCIHNKLTPDKRDEAVARFKSGEARVLVNVTIASYGFDAPSCDCIVVARPTKSIVLWLQMLGRGMRIHPEKAVCRVLDHAGNTRALGEAEDSFRWELKGKKAVTNVTRERKEAVARQDFTCADCGYMFSGSRTCPNCGWEAPLTKKDVAVIDADLVRIGKEQVKALPKEWPAPEMVYRMLKGHAVFSNYKEGWVAHKFKERCQVWPPNEWKGLAGIPPSPIVKNWIISQNIRYAKRKAG